MMGLPILEEIGTVLLTVPHGLLYMSQDSKSACMLLGPNRGALRCTYYFRTLAISRVW